ncbi:MAG: GatB/YqeY domain-containing protein [Candidatus Margulisbacteria bacterium]|nr:GatB/YqeY domain-containing protein [Candidatus Margulisiibacteriota bacterium]MBU1022316.1 GatB/YqeY domain-containing protein [Candidatus Margulisiibacteriota bacterium]MBU1729929.1 GatB/YqeY domain-containing protein [Candidatus Margulisiibacteriota bacterium]MBU1955962.1 GatB/YqeY domain-containing protein [Candidatus Margulisiibacteriota bacterium]
MFKKINDDIKAAMKAKDTLRLETLRMMKSKILLVNARGDLPEAELIKIVTKYGKALKEEAEEAEKVGRQETADKAKLELIILNEYLPKQLSEEEIKNAVKKAIQDVGASGMKDMGKVMKEVLEKNPGVDGKIVSQQVRELLK